MSSLLLKSLLVSSLMVCSNAWWNTGHLLVARIAYDKLKSSHQSVLDKSNSIISHLAQFTTLEKNYTFVEAATFADEIKPRGWADQADWHFVDNPFYDGYQGDAVSEAENITWALGELISALGGVKSSNPISQTEGAISWDLANSFNLRLLIHYVGDIHQPLHSSTRFTANHPTGDRGGNDFHITSKDGASNLHALWDCALYTYTDDLIQPLSVNDWNFLGSESSRLTSQYPEGQFSDIGTPYTMWNQEALDITMQFVYENISENTLPSDSYISSNKKIVEKQLVRAGYRLANLLVQLFGTSSNDQVEEVAQETSFLQ